MADIFNEVDEEVRRERLRQFWAKYGYALIALAVLSVFATAGWRIYEWQQAGKAAEAGAAFEAALELANRKQHTEAEAAFAKVAAEGTPGYRALARVRQAGEIAQRDPAAGVKAYDEIAGDSAIPSAFRDAARLRAAMLLVDTAPYEEVRRRLEPLTGAKDAFRHTAREMVALAAWKAGDAGAVKRWSDMILADNDSPAGARSRVEMMMTLLSASAKS